MKIIVPTLLSTTNHSSTFALQVVPYSSDLPLTEILGLHAK